jgi:hypothetical protein
MTCFEVLDYDSLTNVTVGSDKNQHVVALIYKKVTITHTQTRTFSSGNTTTMPNSKSDGPTIINNELQKYFTGADNFTHSGSRNVEYILCLLVGIKKYIISLGEVNISVTGSYNVSGKIVEMVEEGYDSNYPPNTYQTKQFGPTFTVTGNRIYGVSINCGKEIATFSYDVDELDNSKSFSSNVNWLTDSPINLEDTNINDMWIKKNRVVGVVNYYGISKTQTFPCAEFPDKVMAVNYAKIRR